MKILHGINWNSSVVFFVVDFGQVFVSWGIFKKIILFLALQKQPFPDNYKIGLLKNFVKLTGKHLHRSLYLMKLQASSQQLYWERDPTQTFSFKFTDVLKKIFFTIVLGAAPAESSSPATCLDIIIQTSKWHQFRHYFLLYCQLWKCVLSVQITLEAIMQN